MMTSRTAASKRTTSWKTRTQGTRQMILTVVHNDGRLAAGQYDVQTDGRSVAMSWLQHLNSVSTFRHARSDYSVRCRRRRRRSAGRSRCSSRPGNSRTDRQTYCLQYCRVYSSDSAHRRIDARIQITHNKLDGATSLSSTVTSYEHVRQPAYRQTDGLACRLQDRACSSFGVYSHRRLGV